MKTIFKIFDNQIQELELMGEDEKCIYLPAPKGRIYPQEYEEDIVYLRRGEK